MPRLERNRMTVVAGAIALVAAVGALAFGAGHTMRGDASTGEVVAPAAEVIFWDDQIALVDTTNGAVYTLRGNVDNASSTMTWRQRVTPISGTSGYLQIQRATMNDLAASITGLSDEIFLVDRLTGATWILRNRASSNGSWDRVARYER